MQFKIGAITIIILAVIGFWQWDRGNAFEAGVNSEKAKQAEAEKTGVKVVDSRVIELNKERDEWKLKAIDLQEKLNNKKKATKDEIKKALANAKCDALGVDSLNMWNSFIGTEPSY